MVKIFLDNERRISDYSLEELIQLGETKNDANKDYTKITVYDAASWFVGVIRHIKRKHRNVPTASAVERFVTKMGILVLQDNKTIKEIEKKRKDLYEDSKNILDHNLAYTKTYNLKHMYSARNVKKKNISTFNWVHGAITELADTLSYSMSSITKITFCAGVGRYMCMEDISSIAKYEVEQFITEVARETLIIPPLNNPPF